MVVFLGSVPCPFRHRLLSRNPGAWDSYNAVFVWKVLQKSTFRRSRNFDELGVDFCCVLCISAILVIFDALKTGLELDDFPWPPGVLQKLEPGESEW